MCVCECIIYDFFSSLLFTSTRMARGLARKTTQHIQLILYGDADERRRTLVVINTSAVYVALIIKSDELISTSSC